MVNVVKVEIQTAPATWTDITSDVYQRGSVSITRGRSDEQSAAQPQRLTLTLDNRDGKFSPRNPLSPLYGQLGRNTPVRCTIDSGAYTRFYGEIPSLAPRWIEGHRDNWVEVEAYGILRRLGQGQPPVSSALRDWVLAQSHLVAYYPLSGGDETTYSQNLAPGVVGSFHASANAVYAYGKEITGASWIGSVMELNSTGALEYMEGGAGAQTSNVALDFVFQSPAMGVLDIELWPSQDSLWTLRLNDSSDHCKGQVFYYNDDVGTLSSSVSSVIPELQDSEFHTCRFELDTIAGPLIQYSYYIDGRLIATGNFGSGITIGWLPFFRFHYERYVNQTVMNIGHLSLWAANPASSMPTVADYTDAAFAYSGETAIDRLIRVCADGNIPLTVTGVSADSTPMGPSYTETRLEQIREAEATDLGILAEARDAPGLSYVPRAALYNQTPAFTLAYSNGQVFPPLEPVDDDQNTRNDVTATKREGTSARYTIDSGPLSTQDPPNGVGRYESELTVNPEGGGSLYGIAAWIANLGTLDRSRWPLVTVNLNSPNLSTALKNQVKAAEIGNLFTITGLQKAYVYEDVALIIVGYSELISKYIHQITFNCAPAEPYNVAVYGTDRYDADNSTLTSGISSSATSLSATKSGTTLWTTDSSQLPFDLLVGGERMTATSITGSTSPQTITVTRHVNGVVKAQTAGTVIALWDTPRYAL